MAQNTVSQMCERIFDFGNNQAVMLASVRQPSFLCYNACMVSWAEGASRGNCRQKDCETSFLLIFRHFWVGRAKHLGPALPCHVAVEFFNVGSWLSHGDLALGAGVCLSGGC